MIKLDRIREENAIVPSFQKQRSKERLVDLMQQRREKLANGEDPKLKIASRWSVTKKQLLKETFEKCAYCESDTTVVVYGDVEHYRPKSIYWWLAYVYDNYLASCSICNQQFKSDQFEFLGAQLEGPDILLDSSDVQIETWADQFAIDPLDNTAVSAFVQKHRNEKPLIPNPYIDDPENFFAWNVVAGTKEVELVAKEGIDGASQIVDACERIYGLNRAQLKRRRFKQWRNYRFSLAVMMDNGADSGLRDEAKEFIQLSMQPDSEYAAMVRYFEEQRTGIKWAP